MGLGGYNVKSKKKNLTTLDYRIVAIRCLDTYLELRSVPFTWLYSTTKCTSSVIFFKCFDGYPLR